MYSIAGLLLLATVIGARNPSANEILIQARTAQSWHDQVRMRVHLFGTDDKWGRTDDFNCQYSNRGTDTMYVGSRVMREAGGEIWVSVEHIYNIKTPEFYVLAEKVKTGPDAEGVFHSKPYPNYWRGAETGAPAWGYLTVLDSRHICDVLSEAEDLKVGPEPIEINQERCFIISGTTKYGQVEVAVSPEKGYYPVQYHVRGPLTDRTRRPDDGEQDTWVNLGEFRSIDGRWIPTRVSKRLLTPTAEGALRTLTWEVELSDIELDPVFDAVSFTLGLLPDGTILNDGKVHAIRYIVKNGQLTPEVDDQSVQSMDKAMSEVVKPASAAGREQAPDVNVPAGPVSGEATKPEAAAGTGAPWKFWPIACIGAGVLIVLIAGGYLFKKRSSSGGGAHGM